MFHVRSLLTAVICSSIIWHMTDAALQPVLHAFPNYPMYTIGENVTLACKIPKGNENFTFFKDSLQISTQNNPDYFIQSLDYISVGSYNCENTDNNTISLRSPSIPIHVYGIEMAPTTQISLISSREIAMEEKSMYTSSVKNDMETMISMSLFTQTSQVFYSMIFYMTPRVSSANPQLQLEPEQTVYIVGEALTMRCRANNPSTVTSYSFFVDGALLSNSSSNVQQFPELTLKDAGMYFCTYSRPSFTSTESNTIQLNIVDRPNSPTISVDPESPVHFIGQKVTVHCLMESRSGVTAITLYRNGNELDGSDNFGVLTLEQITQRNAGNYSCAFSIQMNGRVIMSYQSILRPLIVTDPLQTPALSIYPRNPQKADQRVELICRTPSPSTVSGYRFYQNGREVTEKSGIRENVFILLSFHSSLEGCYFCKTYRRVMGVEVSSSESPEQSLTEKETGGRTCNHVNQTMHDFLSPQGLKLYGSVLVGKLIVFIGVTAVFGIQLLLIKKRNQKTEMQT